jgi:hydrogenase-4 component F
MGIIVFAFGMGGPLANFAGLMHMTMHSLTKSAIFFTVGHVAHAKGTQRIEDIRGLTQSHPALGWGLLLGTFAIAGMPPMGMFMSEFLLVSTTIARQPLLAIPLVLGLLLAFGALLTQAMGMAFGEGKRGTAVVPTMLYLPEFAHFGLVLVAGVYIPPPVVAWFQHVAELLG